MRYVILEHFVPGSLDRPDHWDLMFESNGVLKTWSVRKRPDLVGSQPAKQLFNHRLVYLTHQGPVVGRGWVKRWDEGTYRLPFDRSSAKRFLLDGQRLSGICVLAASSQQHWKFRFTSRRIGGRTGRVRNRNE